MTKRLPKCKPGEKVFEVCYQSIMSGKNKGGRYTYRKYAAISDVSAEMKWREWANRRKTSYRLVEIVEISLSTLDK